MKRTAIPLITALLVLFSACEKGIAPDGQGGKSGVKNTTDLAVTGELLEVGMTYADVKGYVNISTEVSAAATSNALVFRMGVWYGESMDSMNRQATGTRNGREFTVTIPDLKAGKKYYYQSFLEWGDYVPTAQGDWEPYFDQIGLGSEIASFTTKELKYDGTISADEARNITFFQADISGKVDMSSLNAKETVRRGFVWSSSRDAITGQLASSLEEARYENTPGDAILLQVSEGYFVNDNLHFFVGEKAETTLFSEPGDKIYYTPFLIISGTSFTGEPREVTLRTLAQTSGFVDLGLSCLWGATNCSASSPWEMGVGQAAGYDSSDLAQAFGSGMRLPSKEEVEELNQRCFFEAIDNGVLITGPNGNQIFIPSKSLADSYRSGNSLINNTYLTGSTRSEYVFGKWDKYQIGYYYLPDKKMTTTELPILSYPYNASQNYYLHPVRDGQGGSGGGGGSGGSEDLMSKVLGTYTINEFELKGTANDWEYSDWYEMEISRMYSSGNMVNVYNFWNKGATIEATVLDSGDISIPAGQYLFTHSSYGDFSADPFDVEAFDYAKTDYILLKYDSYNDMYHSTPFIISSKYGYYGIYEILMWHK